MARACFQLFPRNSFGGRAGARARCVRNKEKKEKRLPTTAVRTSVQQLRARVRVHVRRCFDHRCFDSFVISFSLPGGEKYTGQGKTECLSLTVDGCSTSPFSCFIIITFVISHTFLFFRLLQTIYAQKSLGALVSAEQPHLQADHLRGLFCCEFVKTENSCSESALANVRLFFGSLWRSLQGPPSVFGRQPNLRISDSSFSAVSTPIFASKW